MFILFYLSIILVGLYLLSFFPKDLTLSEKISAVFLLGTLLVTVVFFLAYPLTAYSGYLLYLPFLFSLPFFVWQRKKIIDSLTNLTENFQVKSEISIIIVSLAFSSLLFLRTIWLDFKTGQMQIAGKLWSDFGAHIPLIKSFSVGFNFPPEYPLFPGEHIRYHFLADFHFAVLEKMGLPLFWGINLFSIFSFTALLLLIYSLCLRTFHQKKIALLSVLLFLFNSSLAYLNIFKKIPFPGQLSWENIFLYLKTIIANRDFLAFGPYDNGLVTAFWSLNIYTNQRHLAFGLSHILLFLIIVYIHFKKKILIPNNYQFFGKIKAIFFNNNNFPSLGYFLIWGIIFGLMPLVHSGIFIIIVLNLPLLFFIYPNWKFFFFATSMFLVSAPTLLYFQSVHTTPEAGINFHPYFHQGLITGGVLNFFKFWFFNLGLLPIFTILGVFFSSRKKRLLFALALNIFIISNFLSFAPDLNTNHKFLNFSVIIFNFYAAYFIVFISSKFRPIVLKIIMLLILIIPVTFSGFLDFFPTINDKYYGLPDPNQESDISWIEKNTPKNAVFVNTTYLFHPASLAGRMIVFGWPYFSWSAGYDTHTRGTNHEIILKSNDLGLICRLTKELKANYVSINSQVREEPLTYDEKFWRDNFPLLYENKNNGFLIFDVNASCLNQK